MTAVRHLLPLALVATAGLGLAACGGDGGGDSSTRTTTTTRAATTTTTSSEDTNVPVGSLAPSSGTPGALPSSAVPVTLPRFFQNDSPWNVVVAQAPIDPNSDRLLTLAKQRRGVVEQANTVGVETAPRIVNAGVYVNTVAWTTAIVGGSTARQTRVFCRQRTCGPDAKGIGQLPIPPNASPDPRYDGWFTVLDTGNRVAYDLWRARRQRDGSVSFQFLRRWDLNGPGFGAPGTVSARGSGLPLFAGVITRQELQQGRIDHALAISLPGPSQRNYVSPASSTDGIGDVSSIPEGARIRVRDTYELGGTDTGRRRGEESNGVPRGAKRRAAQAILRALQTYGAIVVDRSRVPTLYAQKDVTQNLVRGDELSNLKIEDFEVLELPRRRQFPGRTPTSGSAGGGNADETTVDRTSTSASAATRTTTTTSGSTR